MNTIAPGYLIAAPNMVDPNFAKAVVLMAEHTVEGAIGFIVNKPTPVDLGLLLRSVDEDLAELAETNGMAHLPVMLGGPVQKHIAWVLYKRLPGAEPDEGAIAIGEELTVGASIETLRSFISGQRTGPFRVLLGYSGWGQKQLEGELFGGSWLPLDLVEGLTFNSEQDEIWNDAVRHLGLTPGAFTMGPSGGQA